MQAWHEEWAHAVYRVLKPGAHLVAFGGTRTYHRLACALEDAGFEIRDSLMWIYGSGFPKSLAPYRAIMSGLCRSYATVPHAVRVSPLTRVESGAAKTRIAAEPVLTQPGGELVLLMEIGTADGSSARMAMSPSACPTATNLNIASSWSASWADDWKRESRSITETVTRLITDSATLSFCRSALMQAGTTPVASQVDGCECGAWPVVEISSDGSAKWNPIPLRIAAEPATSTLLGLDGLGSALKPAHEPIVLARKPLAGTVAANVLEYGTGALNIDGCRVGTTVETWPSSRSYAPGQIQPGGRGKTQPTGEIPAGRWPPNVLLTHGACCGEECGPCCPVAEMDRQSGPSSSSSSYRPPDAGGTGNVYTVPHPEGGLRGHDDSGGASRFFPRFRYEAKAASRERNAGLEGMPVVVGGGLQSTVAGDTRTGHITRQENNHPTVKPVALMRWLCRLVTPPGGLILDPFLGSGTTMIAALREGFRCVGIEREAEYVSIARRRVEEDMPLFNRAGLIPEETP